jgi:cytochrome b
VVRASHASVAACVLVNYVRDDGDPLHRSIGYAAAAVVGIRLLWAVAAKGHAGIRALKPSLSDTRSYVRHGAPRSVGHDPLGLWMVWLLWALVLLLALTGWMGRLDAFWGDERVEQAHEWLADALVAAVAVHVTGVAVMSRRWRENLAKAMWTGRKRR